MQYDSKQFSYSEDTRTFACEASEMGLRQTPNTIGITHNGQLLNFQFSGNDKYQGEVVGFLYVETVASQKAAGVKSPRRLLIIND